MNGIVMDRPATVEVMPEPAPQIEQGINAPLIIGFIGVALFLIASLGAPLLAPYGPTTADTLNRLKGPSALHFVGTDQFGRDTFSRLLYGGRLSLVVAAISVESVSLAEPRSAWSPATAPACSIPS